MKKLVVLLLVGFNLMALSVYDWVEIKSIKDLDINNYQMSITYNANARKNGEPIKNILIRAMINQNYFSFNMDQLIKVNTVRFKRDLLQESLELYEGLIENNN